MSSLRMYDMTAEYNANVESCIDPETGELDIDRFEQIQAESQEAITIKAANTACYIRELEAEAEAVAKVGTDALQRAKTMMQRADWLRSYLQRELTLASLPKVSDARISISLRKNPPSVRIDTPEAIPLDLCRSIPARIEPDKTLIKEALKSGQTIPGAVMVQTTRLEIK